MKSTISVTISLALTTAAVAFVPTTATAFDGVFDNSNLTFDVTSWNVPAKVKLKDGTLFNYTPDDFTFSWVGEDPDALVSCEQNSIASSMDQVYKVGYTCFTVVDQKITMTVSYQGKSETQSFNYVTPKPGGKKSDYKLYRDGSGKPYKFKPCVTIPVRLNKGVAPLNPDLEYAVKFAVGKVAQASGLKLRYKGKTKFMPQQSRQTPDKGIVIGYAYPGKRKGGSNLLWRKDESTLGRGGFYSQSRWIQSGMVVLNRKLVQNPETLIHVTMHELGHAVGLNHSSGDGDQVMDPYASEYKTNWGKGDLVGLKKVGPGRSC